MKLYDVSIKRMDFGNNLTNEDSQPLYLHVTEEQIVLLRWLETQCFLEVFENDLPPKQIDLSTM